MPIWNLVCGKTKIHKKKGVYYMLVTPFYRSFVSDANDLKQLIEKIGSNPQVRGKKIEFDLVKPYGLAREHKTLEAGGIQKARKHQGYKKAINGEHLYWRRGWDSNPRYLAVNTLSKRARSATLPPLRIQHTKVANQLIA